MRMSNSISESIENRRGGVDDSPITNARLAKICYILVCMHVLLINYIVIVHPNIYFELIREDGWIENFTAVLFLVAAIALFAAAWAERRILPRCACILGGVALALFAAEEISWGQRIIGFETPAFLMGLNRQSEFNIHNIPEVYDTIFAQARRRSLFYALGIASVAAFFCRKERILGIPTPPILLTLALLITITFANTEARSLSYILWTIMFWQQGLLLLLLLFASFSRNAMLFIATAVSMSLTLAVGYVDVHNNITFYSEEVSEYLISLIAFFYALAALPAQGAARQVITEVAAALKPATALPSTRQNRNKFFNKIKRGYLTPWTAACALIVAGSVGLAFLVQLDVRADAAAFKETYSLVRTQEPIARSNFDVYLYGRHLHYFKQPCNESDTRRKFFLSIFPANVLNLSADRWQSGFENFDFHFDIAHRSKVINDACAATVRLPAYEIASISTGQYRFEGSAIRNLWIAEFPLNPPE